MDESIESLRSLVRQEDPIGKVVSRTELDDGLVLEKVTCPIGVIGVIFESRPDALVQISTLCLKSGNAVLLKGGSEAAHTNQALFETIDRAAQEAGVCAGWASLLHTRDDVEKMRRMADEAADLVLHVGGTLSGEHGDGLARTAFIRSQYGPLYKVFREIKDIFDPHNLLNPGKTPQDNISFLVFLIATVRAVYKHADVLRAAVASYGNDHRLGANEAPPAIISVFLGEQLTQILENIEKGTIAKATNAEIIDLGISSLSHVSKDNTDRNRTSPFAFTGNKFEFRAPGSSQSCAEVNTVLNTIVAESLDYLSERLEKLSTADFNTGLQALLKAVIKEHQRIIFNGDNYSADWVKEAEKRGLPNLRDTMEAIKPLLKPENQDIFVRYGVFSKIELASRYEVYMEEYHRRIRIEGGIAAEIARSLIFPVVTEEYRRVLTALNAAKVAGISHGVEGLRISAELLGKGLDELQRRGFDDEAVFDQWLSFADAYLETPRLHLTWFEKMAERHCEKENIVAAAMCELHIVYYTHHAAHEPRRGHARGLAAAARSDPDDAVRAAGCR